MPSFKDNVKFLNSFIVRAPEANKNKIQTIADLYEQKKIVNFKTALNTTMLLASTNKSVIKSGKADKEFDKVFNKYDLAVPMTGRIQRQIQEKKQELERNKIKEEIKKRKNKKNPQHVEIQKLHKELLGSNSKSYLVDIILYKDAESIKEKKAAEKQAVATGSRYYKGLYQVYAGQQNIEFITEQKELLNIKHSEF